MVFKRFFTAEVLINFLERLIRQSKSKVFLIIDGHPVHKSAKVKKWLAAKQKHIQISLLPGNSPDLNPDEMLNQDVKSIAVRRQHAGDQKEPVPTVRSLLWRRQRQPHIVKRYFHEEHVRYAAT